MSCRIALLGVSECWLDSHSIGTDVFIGSRAKSKVIAHVILFGSLSVVLSEANLDHRHKTLSTFLTQDDSGLIPGVASIESIDNVAFLKLCTPLIWFPLGGEGCYLVTVDSDGHLFD
jgi:hypothetical protein